MSKVNKNIAVMLGATDADVDEGMGETTYTDVPTPVAPHEVTMVKNPDLPDTYDQHYRRVEGEGQLDGLIDEAMDMFSLVKEDYGEVDPQFRSRHIEVGNGVLGTALSAIQTKLKMGIDERKLRLAEAKHSTGGAADPGVTVNPGQGVTNVYVSRETMLQKIAAKREAQAAQQDIDIQDAKHEDYDS